MTSSSLVSFLKELEEFKVHLQNSLQLFRQARQKLKLVDLEKNEFLFRRFIQLERDALRNFEKDIRHMNQSIEKRIKSLLMSFNSGENEDALLKIRRELRHLKNAFDSESPVLSAALAQFDSRVEK